MFIHHDWDLFRYLLLYLNLIVSKRKYSLLKYCPSFLIVFLLLFNRLLHNLRFYLSLFPMFLQWKRCYRDQLLWRWFACEYIQGASSLRLTSVLFFVYMNAFRPSISNIIPSSWKSWNFFEEKITRGDRRGGIKIISCSCPRCKAKRTDLDHEVN